MRFCFAGTITADGENSCSRTVILNLTNGDKVRLRMDVLDNNGGVTTLADGSSITIKKFIESGADYVEVYYTKDKDLSAGDIVTLDTEIKAGVKKAQTNSPIIGIVSTDPGKTIGAGTHWEEGRPVPVALNGRVPVKVELEEGDKIVAGDYITVSRDKVDFGTKTTQPGYVVGIALTGFNGENSKAINGKIYGTVLVFLDKQWFPGEDALLAQQFNKNNNEILSENIGQLLGLIIPFLNNVIPHTPKQKPPRF